VLAYEADEHHQVVRVRVWVREGKEVGVSHNTWECNQTLTHGWNTVRNEKKKKTTTTKTRGANPGGLKRESLSLSLARMATGG
jgi:hypothetical protein